MRYDSFNILQMTQYGVRDKKKTNRNSKTNVTESVKEKNC